MPLNRAQTYRFRPRGVTDTLDGSSVVPGSMSEATNLIFDPGTPFSLQCRPAATQISDFSGFTTPGAISAAAVIGDKVYGLVASGRNSGKDEPFVFDLLTNTFVTVSGITSGNSPVTQPSSGAWTPPTIATTGVYVVVTHPGFPGSGMNFGWFDITNPAAPVWHAGNTTTNALPGVPTNVQQFNSRFYFSVGNQLWYTDALTLTITNVSQELTIGDSEPITALAPFALSTTSQGVLQAILVFKSNKISEVTGDQASSDLAVNDLPEEVGTVAPRSVVPTPIGVKFMADDGLRMVRIDGFVSPPDADIRVPFMNALVPSRVSAAYGTGIYRICLQNSSLSGSPYQEFWYDSVRGGWTGPHTFRQDIALPYGDSFVCFDNGHPGKMYTSDVLATISSSFTEYGSPLQFSYATSSLPDGDTVYQNSAVVVCIDMVFPSSVTGTTFSASDVYTGVLSSASLFPTSTPTLWGAFVWGAALWYGQTYGLRMFQIPFDKTLVFSKLVLRANGVSTAALRLGSYRVEYQRLGYVPQ